MEWRPFFTGGEGQEPRALSEVRSVIVRSGHGKAQQPELIEEVRFAMGDVASIVGPTGSGKTAFINDIEVLANRNTPTGRQVLINDEIAPQAFGDGPSLNPVARITQHTNFLSDLPVQQFLALHAEIREHADSQVVAETLDFANQLTGEPIIPSHAMTELSGGQTRALLIADAVVIGNSPILLLDEIENAGIHRTRALEMLRQYKKIFIFVTHDPRIALLSDYRIVLANGAMQRLIVTEGEEREVGDEIRKLDDIMLGFRERLWRGERIGRREFDLQLGGWNITQEP
jgi:ABC-type lipoprotein export system ATPase subunit